ncbi:MAG: hypothetical protein ACPGSP_04860 [Alphaproteobacteria bacterium]
MSVNDFTRSYPPGSHNSQRFGTISAWIKFEMKHGDRAPMTTCRNFAAALGLIALTLLALNGTAVAEPRLERLVAAEQSLTRKIELTQRRLSRDQKQLHRAARQ